MKTNCIELNCSECCSRYWITILPKELKKAAARLKISEKKFIEKNCVLHLNLFPSNTKTKLAVSSVFLPKKIAKKIKHMPPYFIVLASIAFRRGKNGTCIFLSKNLCKIYSARPKQCALFPFISMDKKPLKKQYAFCKALSSGSLGKIDKAQAKNVSAYFESVAKKAFEKIWPALPSSGVVCLENREFKKISKKEFLGIVKFI